MRFAFLIAATTACSGGSTSLRAPDEVTTTTSTVASVAIADGLLYFSTLEGVFSVPVEGGTPTQLSNESIGEIVVASGFVIGSNLARLSIEGGTPENLAASTGVSGFAIDGDRVVWTYQSQVYATSLAGPLTATPTVLVDSGTVLTAGGPMVVDDSRIYVSTNETFEPAIVSMAKDGSDLHALPLDMDLAGLGGVRAMVSDDTRLYMLTSTGGGITNAVVKATSKDGGMLEEYFETDRPNDPACRAYTGLALDGDRLWVSCRTSRGTKLRRLAKTGGPFSSIVELLDADNLNGESFQITTAVFDDDHAYFGNGRTVYRVEK